MNLVNKKIAKISPAYLVEYEELIKIHSQFGGGAGDEKFHRGKTFSNVYEFYTYAFFIGLYKNKRVELISDDTTKTFWEIENWKPKELTDYMLACAMAESEFDMTKIEQIDEKGVSDQIKLLKNRIEEFANGGFSYIKNKFDKEPDLIDDDTFFIKLLSEDGIE